MAGIGDLQRKQQMPERITRSGLPAGSLVVVDALVYSRREHEPPRRPYQMTDSAFAFRIILSLVTRGTPRSTAVAPIILSMGSRG